MDMNMYQVIDEQQIEGYGYAQIINQYPSTRYVYSYIKNFDTSFEYVYTYPLIIHINNQIELDDQTTLVST